MERREKNFLPATWEEGQVSIACRCQAPATPDKSELDNKEGICDMGLHKFRQPQDGSFGREGYNEVCRVDH